MGRVCISFPVWASRNGINGFKITSRTNNKWIFLPAANFRERDGESPAKGYYGIYWSGDSSESRPSEAYVISFAGQNFPRHMEKDTKYQGLTIRPVRNKSYSRSSTRVDYDALYRKSEAEAGNSISSDLSELDDADSDTIFTDVETVPEFPGGFSALMSVISQQLRYPDSAARKGIEGRVRLSFVIEKNGSISDIREISSPDEALTIEAMRVLSLLPAWKAATQNGKSVRSRVFLPITFRLTSSEQNK